MAMCCSLNGLFWGVTESSCSKPDKQGPTMQQAQLLCWCCTFRSARSAVSCARRLSI